MLATSIDPHDVGETPTAPIPTPVAPAGAPEPAQARSQGEIARLKDRIKGYVRDFPDRHGDADKPVPPDNLTVRRGDVRLEAWRNSLIASDVTDLVRIRLANLDADQQPTTLNRFAQSLSTDAPFRNLVVAGKTGRGKTAAAIAVGWAALDQGLTVRFVEHSKYLLWLRPDSTPSSGPYRGITPHQIRDRMRTCDVLIVDDLAASLDPALPVTQFVKDETLTLIGDRIDTPGRITVVTTNRTVDELDAMFGEQFVSRLSKNGYSAVFKGKDRRGRLSW